MGHDKQLQLSHVNQLQATDVFCFFLAKVGGRNAWRCPTAERGQKRAQAGGNFDVAFRCFSKDEVFITMRRLLSKLVNFLHEFPAAVCHQFLRTLWPLAKSPWGSKAGASSSSSDPLSAGLLKQVMEATAIGPGESLVTGSGLHQLWCQTAGAFATSEPGADSSAKQDAFVSLPSQICSGKNAP